MRLKLVACCRHNQVSDMTIRQSQTEHSHLPNLVDGSTINARLVRQGLLPDASIRSILEASHLMDNDNEPSQDRECTAYIGGEYDDLVVVARSLTAMDDITTSDLCRYVTDTPAWASTWHLVI